jgi:DNA-binding NarL/FixJ family response regulator
MLELAADPVAVGEQLLLVAFISGSGRVPDLDWGAGIVVKPCACEAKQLRLLLATSWPGWCIVDETVDDRRMREIVIELRRSGSGTRILMLGPSDDFARCDRWIRRGVKVYLAAGSPVERIVEAMRHADLEDTVVIDASIQRPMLELVSRFQPSEELSARELEVLRLASRGLRTEEIAAALHLTAHTVSFHLGNVAAKLGVRGRTQAVVRGLLLGLIAAVDASA